MAYVKEAVFGVDNGAPTVSANHPVMKALMETVIGGMYCAIATPAQTSLICCRVRSLHAATSKFHVFFHAANFKSHVLFEDENSARKLETTVLKNRKEPSQKMFSDLLGALSCMNF
jgi:hypothetical protein